MNGVGIPKGIAGGEEAQIHSEGILHDAGNMGEV